MWRWPSIWPGYGSGITDTVASAAKNPSRSKGRFITVEGVEGVGKSTNVAFVADWLRGRGYRVVITREPGGTPVAEGIRDLLLAEDLAGMSDTCELLLMFAARASHIAEVIRPALATGQWVVCDRFTDATYAYQGAGRGVDRQAIAALEQLVQRELRPDLTILLEAPQSVTGERRRNRGVEDRFEGEDPAFHERVQGAYTEIAVAEPERVKRVDASRSLAAVQAEIGDTLQHFLDKIDE